MGMNHLDQVLALLKTQIDSTAEVDEIRQTAGEVGKRWVDPASGGKDFTNGLIYGLVQSGKTGVLTVTGAIGVDAGYRCLIILTSDNDPLYDQTLGRVREAFPGMDIVAKAEFKDQSTFTKRIRGGPCAIVTTKNGNVLRTLCENLQQGKVRGVSCLIIDDEADQASLNTKESKQDGTRSKINDRITELRGFFDKNTYLQVTATPQALFLQAPHHDFRPKFTVLSHPGADYVGGDDFFGEASTLIRQFDIADISALTAAHQPAPTLAIPASLVKALDQFMIGATFKRTGDPTQNCAFLCHVSTRKDDHAHIVALLHKYKQDLLDRLHENDPKTLARLKDAYDDLAKSHAGVEQTSLNALVQGMAFFGASTTIKLVNGDTDEDVAVKSPYNLFVGGNKLGRGVTIKNLLVSYYGRNPKRPQADTVLQHARMFGYRRSDIGLLRLFLPRELRMVFQAVHKMETGLRDLISQNPSEEFRGIYVEGPVVPTRPGVTVPGAIGVYTGGSIYNPAQVLRSGPAATSSLKKLDSLLEGIPNKSHVQMPIKELCQLIALTAPDPDAAEFVWNDGAVTGSLLQWAKLHKVETGYVYVDRDRGLEKARRETQGILDGGEKDNVPTDMVTLFLLRNNEKPGQVAAWWPQIRFPQGRYAFAFAI
jgi:hypothetical protein